MKKLIAIALCLALALPLPAAGPSPRRSRSAPAPPPHAEILAVAKDILAEEGIELEIIEFADYVIPNTSLESGDLRRQLLPAQALHGRFQRRLRYAPRLRRGHPL